MSIFKTRQIQTTIHGLYIIQQSRNKTPCPLLVGFHGYGETAEKQLKMMQQIPGVQSWLCCSIQALHPFYNSKGQIGYNWMTSQDRELRIQENIKYVNTVINELKESYSINDTIVFHGFSQGTAMACRAAVLGEFQASGVILLGGDIPPELKMLNRIGRILLSRGKNDRFYKMENWKEDVERIKRSNLEASFCTFDGGHEGNDEYFNAAGEFLKYYIK